MDYKEYDDYKFFIENDNNPFILFNADKKIAYLNIAAEFLLGKVSKYDIYNLCMTYAPKEYGSKMTYIDLKFDDLSYYGVTVGYQDEEYIGIRLYQRVKNRLMSAKELSKYVTTDINMLLETFISLLTIKKDYKIKLITDMDIPEFKISQNDFFKILRKCFDTFDTTQGLYIALKMRVGEFVYVKNERTQLVKLEIRSKRRDRSHDIDIEKLCEDNYIDFLSAENKIRLIIPMLK